MKVAIIGTRGIPNNYGGFETLAEYLVLYLAKDFDITVYCSAKDMDSNLTEYNGAKLKYINVTSHGFLGMLYDSISLLKTVGNYDKIIFLGPGGGFIMPFIKTKARKVLLNFGGLDWKRNKWSLTAQKVIKKSEELLVKYSGQIIADNIGIQNYILEEYKRESALIAYGGDQAQKKAITNEYIEAYPFLKGDYAFIVTRIQADNNIEMILQAFMAQSTLPIVMVGNWNNSAYGKKIKEEYSGKRSLMLLDAIYDREKLDVLRSNCAIYVHGHSAGGTNPSLVEAMYLGLPIVAFASGYNEYTTENKAFYFKDKNELTKFVEAYKLFNLNDVGNNLKQIADVKYRWKFVTNQYKALLFDSAVK